MLDISPPIGVHVIEVNDGVHLPDRDVHGLRDCRRLVEMQRSRIWAANRDGRRLVVSFTLQRWRR